MELLALDADFEPVGYLSYINLQWTREYYTAGQYSVQVAAGDYDPRMAYLYTPERPEMGIIHKVERTENIKGRFIQISGYFLERLLWDKILWPTYYASGGTIPEAVTAMIQQYKGDIPLLEVLDAPAVSTLDTAVWQETASWGMWPTSSCRQWPAACGAATTTTRIKFIAAYGRARTAPRARRSTRL